MSLFSPCLGDTAPPQMFVCSFPSPACTVYIKHRQLGVPGENSGFHRQVHCSYKLSESLTMTRPGVLRVGKGGTSCWLLGSWSWSCAPSLAHVQCWATWTMGSAYKQLPHPFPSGSRLACAACVGTWGGTCVSSWPQT